MMKQLNTARNSTAPGAIVSALASWLLASTAPAHAADVTYERLLNPEPQNWLMHHGDFNAQRYSPLEVINKSNAKNLKLQFAVALGGKFSRRQPRSDLPGRGWVHVHGR
jgi:glucose dehydrogenase